MFFTAWEINILAYLYDFQVTWTAPNEEELKGGGSSGCIDFRAMVIRRQDYWYMNDGSLTYRICRDTSFVDPSAGQEVSVYLRHSV